MHHHRGTTLPCQSNLAGPGDFAHPCRLNRTAMIVVDMQNDFLPGGSLAIDGADELVPVINGMMNDVDFVVLTQDFHPSDHSSFTTNGGPYPVHCLKGTTGAEFHPNLDIDSAQLVIRKGFRPLVDSPSAFCEQISDSQLALPSGLEGYLRGVGVGTVLVTGVALDICVLQTALDAVAAGFKVYVSATGTRGTTSERCEATWRVLQEHGIKRVEGGLPPGMGDGWRSRGPTPPPSSGCPFQAEEVANMPTWGATSLSTGAVPTGVRTGRRPSHQIP